MLLSAENIALSEKEKVDDEQLVTELVPQFITERNNMHSTTKVIKTVFMQEKIPVEHKK
jgi:hypothetical protein